MGIIGMLLNSDDIISSVWNRQRRKIQKQVNKQCRRDQPIRKVPLIVSTVIPNVKQRKKISLNKLIKGNPNLDLDLVLKKAGF